MNAETLSRMRGCLAGLAVGDALGTTLEFKPPGTFKPLTDLMGGGPFGLRPGQWTDDTSMALCLADSLLEKGWDPGDQMERYVRWWKTGENSATGRCFDIGNTVRAALADYLRSRDPFQGSADPRSAGNGSLMRLAPIPIRFWRDPAMALQRAAEMSRTTHAARTCLDACRYATALILSLFEGRPKTEALDAAARLSDLCPEIRAIADGSFREKEPPAIRGSGYVVESLEAALWAFHRGGDFRSGALLAVNLGNDADTTGAIFGQIAGACHGLDGIPREWLEVLHESGRILETATRLAGG
jgi:ADP-ribosyl-[dinitrogen reductase] hydrolase